MKSENEKNNLNKTHKNYKFTKKNSLLRKEAIK